MRVLELNDQTIFRHHIRDMLLTLPIVPDDFLPFRRKLAFPATVPRSFRLPPRKAVTVAVMCPMPNSLRATLCDHLLRTARTPTGQSR